MLLFSGGVMYAQQTGRSFREAGQLHSEATGARTLEVQETRSVQTETAEHLEALIRAIDTKVEYVNSDQELREKALAEGWFERMAQYRAEAVAKKEALLKEQQTSSGK